jgi:hypothetical protein
MPGLRFEGNEGEDARWREGKGIFRMTKFIGLADKGYKEHLKVF